ncbi:putative HlyD family type I secretion protein [Legionella tunisiensis]|uniref:biotin/lipoyl-binding protein n=1 Tax=Legionella tunisiensis TaxID=1034944 RepID=UPI0003064DB8|nr:biotin/lipoyl-binding protein [Legionella tunisiensis]
MRREEKSRLFTHIILWSAVLFIVCAVLWANYAILDEVTVGQGKVIPSSQVQVIQNLEGGIVSKLYVHEGEIVNKNQVLMQIDNTRFMATYDEAQKIAALEIQILRITAEMDQKPMTIQPAFAKNNAELIEAEKALYQSRQEELKQLNDALVAAEKELSLSRPLVPKGAISEVEILRLERSVSEIKVNSSIQITSP